MKAGRVESTIASGVTIGSGKPWSTTLMAPMAAAGGGLGCLWQVSGCGYARRTRAIAGCRLDILGSRSCASPALERWCCRRYSTWAQTYER